MFRALAQWIFMDKRGRAAAKKLRASQSKAPPPKPKAAGAPVEDSPSSEATGVSSEREALLKETMALYRQRREEYEKLDDDVREKLVKLAARKPQDKDC